MSMINGYKTYIVAAVLAALAVAKHFLGWDVAGMAAENDWLAWLLGAAGLATLRHGVAKVEKKLG